jgi:hypothetical protein
MDWWSGSSDSEALSSNLSATKKTPKNKKNPRNPNGEDPKTGL